MITGLELALWDLKGRALGVPVYQLLGGKVRDAIPVYASGGPSLWPMEQTILKIEHYAKRGYRAVKLSTGFNELPPLTQLGLQVRMKQVPCPRARKLERLTELFTMLRREFRVDIDPAIDRH